MNQNICNICGGVLSPNQRVCSYCDAIIPQTRSSEVDTLLAQGFQLLRLARFDEAEERFKDIVSQFPNEHEAYWGLVLSEFGVKYEGERNGKKVPTCFTLPESLLRDKNYTKALSLAPNDQRTYYLDQADKIEKIRKEWIEKASKEKPYDIFICFKDSDKENGIERTADSIASQELYTHYVEQGYRVFYSRASLRDKVADEYEPYIFNAIQTASVMIVYGQKPEYFEAPFVKNEWQRFKKQIEQGKKNKDSLIVLYKNVSSHDLPKQLSGRQHIDASRITFLQDLDKHIKEVVSRSKAQATLIDRVEIKSERPNKRVSKISGDTIKTKKIGEGKIKASKTTISKENIETREIGGYTINTLNTTEEIKTANGYKYLVRGNYSDAERYFTELIRNNPKNYKAIWGKILAVVNAKTDEEFIEKSNSFTAFDDFYAIMDYADKDYAEKVIEFVFNACKHQLKTAKNTELGAALFEAVVKFNFSKRESLIDFMLSCACELLQTNAKEATILMDRVLPAIQSIDNQIKTLDIFIKTAIVANNKDVAVKYNNKILQIDENNSEAMFNRIVFSTDTSREGFISKIESFTDFELIDEVLEKSDRAVALEFIDFFCFVTSKAFANGYKNDRHFEAIFGLFRTLVKYDFPTVNEFKKDVWESFLKFVSFNAAKVVEFVEFYLKTIDNSNVEAYQDALEGFARVRRTGGAFKLAVTYYNKVLDINEGNTKAIEGKLLAELGATSLQELSKHILSFTNFELFEQLLKSLEEEEVATKVSVYINALAKCPMQDRASQIKADEIFVKLIRYIPVSQKNVFVNSNYNMAVAMQAVKNFEIAQKYYAFAINEDNSQHRLYWGLLQAKLKAKDNKDLIRQPKTLTELDEFDLAISTTNDDEEAVDLYFLINDRQKRRAKDAVGKVWFMFSFALLWLIPVAMLVIGIIAGEYLRFKPVLLSVEIALAVLYLVLLALNFKRLFNIDLSTKTELEKTKIKKNLLKAFIIVCACVATIALFWLVFSLAVEAGIALIFFAIIIGLVTCIAIATKEGKNGK